MNTTGDLRKMLVDTIEGVQKGEIDVVKATTLHKLASGISRSLYEEAKIAIYSSNLHKPTHETGELPLFAKGTKL